MRTGAETALHASGAPAPAPVTPLRRLAANPPDEVDPDRLLRRLAADRIRDLRDEGLTMAYIARMYGVPPTILEEML